MAATELTVQEISLDGLEATLDAATAPDGGDGGDKFENNGRTFVRVANASLAEITVTATSLLACNRGSTHNVSVAVGAGKTLDIGPFPISRFNDANGFVTVFVSLETDVTIGAISVAA